MHGLNRLIVCVCALFMALSADALAQTAARPRQPAAPEARLSFVGLADGARIPARSVVRFALTGMEVVPAGQAKRFSGHHHLLIDTDVPPLDRPIPSDFNHLHFGNGQTETELTLPPGRHTLQLLLADHDHVPHDPPILSQKITVEVIEDPDQRPRSASAPQAKVFFSDLKDGDVVQSPFKVRFGISGMALVPAGTRNANGGHHHLLIDTALPPLDREIPSDFNHVHFGRGQTETEVALPPGEHTLQLLLADHEHVPHDPPVMSERIRVRVAAPAATASRSVSGPGQAPPGRTPAPNDAAVYFIYPRDGERIFPTSTIRFGLRNMGVAPAGTDRPNTGHHHLLIDVPTPPLDRAIPADLNHIHLGNGQTERRITLPPGEHTLQLILADHDHIPHDPPVMSERIKVIVGAGGHRRRKR